MSSERTIGGIEKGGKMGKRIESPLTASSSHKPMEASRGTKDCRPPELTVHFDLERGGRVGIGKHE